MYTQPHTHIHTHAQRAGENKRCSPQVCNRRHCVDSHNTRKITTAYRKRTHARVSSHCTTAFNRSHCCEYCAEFELQAIEVRDEGRWGAIFASKNRFFLAVAFQALVTWAFWTNQNGSESQSTCCKIDLKSLFSTDRVEVANVWAIALISSPKKTDILLS